MRKLIVLVLALGLLVVPALAQDSTTTGQDTSSEPQMAPTMETSTSASTSSQASGMVFASPTVVDIVNQDFVYFSKAIAASGLTDTLESGEYTIFAPNDGAFITLTNNLDMSLDDLMANPALLRVIVSYHVIPGRVPVEDLSNLDMALDTSTLLGPALSFSMDSNVSRVTINGGAASIEQGDVAATNGYVHVIDNVLLPDNYETLAAQTAATMNQSMASNSENNTAATLPQSAGDYVANNFVILEAAVQAAGLQDELDSGQITLFAPTDGAFKTFLTEANISEDQLLSNPSLLKDLLQYHIVPGAVTSAELRNNTAPTTSSNQEALSFGYDPNISRITIDNGRASVVASDIQVNNGVVYVIDNVLVPPDVTLPLH